MTSQPPPRPPRPGAPGGRRPGPQRRRPLVPVLVGVAALLLVGSVVSSVATEVLWFRQLGFSRVYLTQLGVRAGLFVAGGLLMAAAVVVSMALAYRKRPIYAPVPGPAASLDRYREGLEPLRRVLTVVLPLLLGLFAGSAASSRWQTVLLWWNRQPFGELDPVFGHDIGFYVFSLPFLRLVVGLLTAVVLLAGLAGAATHYLYGGLRLVGPGPRTTTAARVQLAVTAAVLVALQAASYWLDRYATLTNSHRRFDGASFTDVTVVVPARAILAIAALICAVLFVVTAVRGNWRFPAAGVGLLVVTAVVAGGIVPAVVQRVQVTPNEASVEAPYIEDNIGATRAAFGIADTQVQQYSPTTEGVAGALSGDAATTASTRILDPAIVSPTFAQNQQVRGFYQFPSPLDVDRYTIDGQSQDVVVAVRELREAGIGGTSWVNTRTAYTHGYGLVAAAADAKQSNGEPTYLEGGIPSSGVLPDYEPRIYFGEESPEYSIVGAPEGARPQEIDYPTDGGEVRNTFSGDGGPSVGNYLERALYAVKFRDANILLSSAVNPESEILYDRDPRERVQKVAPYLTLDSDPYPTVVGGRVQWVVDGYTTSDEYPYSQPQVLEEATADTLTSAGAVAALPPDDVNYLRNSVKATVDAYSGEVVLYAWDESDPVLKAWQGAFPATVQPLSAMSAELMSHVRYPEDLFKVQRTVMASYHVTDPGSFYSQNDFWRVPVDPTGSATTTAAAAPAAGATPAPIAIEGAVQPPYYLTLQMPQQDAATFSLTSTYIPRNQNGEAARNILTGFLAVDADAGDTAGQKREGYGQLRLLQLPTEGTVNGPGQVQNAFNTNPAVGQFLNLLRQGSSTVRYGNLLTLPVGDGLLYVEPVYVQSTGETAYPTLQRVLVAFGDEIGFAPTLDEALDQVFEGNSGVTTRDAGSGTGDLPVDGSGGSGGCDPGLAGRLRRSRSSRSRSLARWPSITSMSSPRG